MGGLTRGRADYLYARQNALAANIYRHRPQPLSRIGAGARQ
jgi:hypothetical protein